MGGAMRAWASVAWRPPALVAVGLFLGFGAPRPVLSADVISSPPPTADGAEIAARSADVDDPAERAREDALLRAVNDYRAAQGLSRWQADPGLAAIARSHSRRMLREGRLSHEGFRQRALRAGSALCVENLVAGVGAPEQAVSMWRRSEAHHRNLLEPGAVWAGVGVAGRYATLLACATPAPPAAPRSP